MIKRAKNSEVCAEMRENKVVQQLYGFYTNEVRKR